MLEPMVLEGRDGLLDHTQPDNGTRDCFRAPMLTLNESLSESWGAGHKDERGITFGRVLVYSKNMVAFAAVTGNAGIGIWDGSALTRLDW